MHSHSDSEIKGSRLSLPSRRGFTLIELLVVITIIVILTSAMIPIMSAASDARRVREGARLVSTMLGSAQTRAMASGRSVGVLFQPMKNNPYASMDLYLVEVPPAYTGDVQNSKAKVQVISKTNSKGKPYSVAQVTFPSADAGWHLVRPGDLIRFDYRGQLFLVDYDLPNGPPPVALDPLDKPIPSATVPLVPTDPSRLDSNGSLDLSVLPPVAWSSTGADLDFQVFRQPIKTVDPPAQLADGAAVDLFYSGIDLAPAPPAGATGAASSTSTVLGTLGTMDATTPPMIVTFSSLGTLEQAYYPSGSSIYQTRPLGGVYFLVGKIENISITGASTPNYEDADCRWVSVTRQSGLPTTAEVASLGGSAKVPSVPLNVQDIQNVMLSRRYASGNQASNGN